MNYREGDERETVVLEVAGGCIGELKSIFKEKVKAKVTKELVSNTTGRPA